MKKEPVRAPLIAALGIVRVLLADMSLDNICKWWSVSMEYQNVYHDFIGRTLENLRKISEKDQTTSFEVTQLINSLLGLIVLPKEKELIRQSDSLSILQRKGWTFPEKKSGVANPKNLVQLIKHLRNGIAHWNIQFHSDKERQLCGVIITNMLSRSRDGHKYNEVQWEGEFSVDVLRDFVLRLGSLAMERAVELPERE